MRLWILRPVNEESAPWEPWFDRAFGFVIGAGDEDAARQLAASDCGDEGPEAWLDPALSSCQELVASEGILMRDFQAA
jgi:hypothetical protein